MRLVAVVVSASFLLACGGSSGDGRSTSPAEDGKASEAEADRKLRAAQTSSIEAMCERLVDCSVEDAKKSMKPEELAELQPEELVPKARATCEREYGALSLSPRQIKVIRRCVNDAPDCSTLQVCLDDVSRKPTP